MYVLMDFLLSMVAGFFAGLHSACWGAFKDSPYEKFGVGKFLRSVLAGILIGFFALIFLEELGVSDSNLGVFFCMVVVLERAFTEFVKAYVRDEPQGKYKIPSRVHILGKVVKSKGMRLLTGFVFSIGFVLFTLMVFKTSGMFSNNIVSGLISGLIGGILIAVGGCLKDAPIEGFDFLKFLRSPMIATIAGVLFSIYSANHGVLMLASMGFERMITEFYKTFFKKTTPGKFKSEKPVYKDWLEKRVVLKIPYAITWLALISFFAFNLHL